MPDVGPDQYEHLADSLQQLLENVRGDKWRVRVQRACRDCLTEWRIELVVSWASWSPDRPHVHPLDGRPWRTARIGGLRAGWRRLPGLRSVAGEAVMGARVGRGRRCVRQRGGGSVIGAGEGGGWQAGRRRGGRAQPKSMRSAARSVGCAERPRGASSRPPAARRTYRLPGASWTPSRRRTCAPCAPRGTRQGAGPASVGPELDINGAGLDVCFACSSKVPRLKVF